ncbi:hypothetical protein [Allocoleopsis sp.]|uniref:hypothetical protein n=1 Tax=Allocoleopsis sp. TaxID=3088169 RepID=UPI002FD44532
MYHYELPRLSCRALRARFANGLTMFLTLQRGNWLLASRVSTKIWYYKQIARTGKMPIPLLVIFSCRVGVPPAPEFDENDTETKIALSS